MKFKAREATIEDIPYITEIYNQGIEDQVATFETSLRDDTEMEEWFNARSDRHKVVVIENDAGIPKGWASINAYQSRCCYKGVGDISIYIHREMRGKGLGKQLLEYLLETAKGQGFHKLILNMLEINQAAKNLYLALGFRIVGMLENQGMLDGKYINVIVMEKLLDIKSNYK